MTVYYQGPTAGLAADAKQELEAYLRANKDGVTLGTTRDGAAHLTIMGLLEGATLDEAYLQTDRNSQKVRNIEAEGTAEIAVSDKLGYAVLRGSIHVLDDDALKAEKWEPWMEQYHPQGPSSPGYVLLRFVPDEVRAMIGGAW